MRNHVRSILVVKNSESQSQKIFIRKTFLCSKDFITEQKKIQHHRIVFVIYPTENGYELIDIIAVFQRYLMSERSKALKNFIIQKY